MVGEVVFGACGPFISHDNKIDDDLIDEKFNIDGNFFLMGNTVKKDN